MLRSNKNSSSSYYIKVYGNAQKISVLFDRVYTIFKCIKKKWFNHKDKKISFWDNRQTFKTVEIE